MKPLIDAAMIPLVSDGYKLDRQMREQVEQKPYCANSAIFGGSKPKHYHSKFHYLMTYYFQFDAAGNNSLQINSPADYL